MNLTKLLRNKNTLLLILLILGLIFRVLLTSGGNFLFNMDNGRDMIDIREMIELGHWRLIGPTSGIEGFYNGPFWYYLLSIPYLLTNGDPYGSIILEILLWFLGGIFIIKLTKRFGFISQFVLSLLWISSNYVLLATQYALNPNPVILLTPVFIYFFERFLKNKDLLSSIFAWSLAGLFFNFEMAFGFLLPIIIVTALIITSKLSFLKNKNFWIGFFSFSLFLAPQLLFELKHDFFMTKSIVEYFNELSSQTKINPLSRFVVLLQSFTSVFKASLINSNLILYSVLIISLFISFKFKKLLFAKEYKNITIILLLLIIETFIIYIVIPINIMAWHLGGVVATLFIWIGLVVSLIQKDKCLKILSVLFAAVVFYLSIANIINYFKLDYLKNDPSLFKNQINAIDVVYRNANNKDFKVYVHIPSVYDYTYQYLIWWHGQNKYGYLPVDYAYLPDKPEYIKGKQSFVKKDPPKENSNKIFLIKEMSDERLRSLWENNFQDKPRLDLIKNVNIEVDIRKE